MRRRNQILVAPSASSLASSAVHPLRLRRLLAALPPLRLRFLWSLRRLRPSPPPLFIRFGCDGSSPPCLRYDFDSSGRSVGFVPRLLRCSSASAATAPRRLASATTSIPLVAPSASSAPLRLDYFLCIAKSDSKLPSRSSNSTHIPS